MHQKDIFRWIQPTISSNNPTLLAYLDIIILVTISVSILGVSYSLEKISGSGGGGYKLPKSITDRFTLFVHRLVDY